MVHLLGASEVDPVALFCATGGLLRSVPGVMLGALSALPVPQIIVLGLLMPASPAETGESYPGSRPKTASLP